jgi:7,8-dihydropterin-6-yl-methyl-4-(beta-D-ribofuranosyl)aminobenzene 5'-phosphate synthase
MGTDIKEQSLLLKNHSDQILIITGCSHPSLVDFINSAKNIAPISGIAGGFHGFFDLKVFENFDLIIPIHCTKKQQEILYQYPQAARLMKVGETLNIK